MLQVNSKFSFWLYYMSGNSLVTEVIEINMTGIKVLCALYLLHGTEEFLFFGFYNNLYMNGFEKVMSLNPIKTGMML